VFVAPPAEPSRERNVSSVPDKSEQNLTGRDAGMRRTKCLLVSAKKTGTDRESKLTEC